MTRDEAITAYTACKDLRLLYNAYRATSRAHALVLERLGESLSDTEDARRRSRREQRLRQQLSLAQETDLVFKMRAEDLTARLDDLRKEWPHP